MAKRPKRKPISNGNGLFRQQGERLDLNQATDAEAAAAFAELRESWRWDFGLAGLREFLADLPDPARCPGRQDERCCGFWRCTTEELARLGIAGCRGGKWKPLDDLEWYRAEIEREWASANHAVETGDANRAASAALNIGIRMTQLDLKAPVPDGPSVEDEVYQRRDIREKNRDAQRAAALKRVGTKPEKLAEKIRSYLDRRPNASARQIGRDLSAKHPDLGSAESIRKAVREALN
jgi:hypothetical protein